MSKEAEELLATILREHSTVITKDTLLASAELISAGKAEAFSGQDGELYVCRID